MNKNSKKCLVVFGPLRISEDPQSFKGKGPGDPFDLFLISKPGKGYNDLFTINCQAHKGVTGVHPKIFERLGKATQHPPGRIKQCAKLQIAKLFSQTIFKHPKYLCCIVLSIYL